MNDSWTVSIYPSVMKKLNRLTLKERRKIVNQIDSMREGLNRRDFKKLSGCSEWSLQIGGWRVLFLVDIKSRVITAVGFGPRGDVYKK